MSRYASVAILTALTPTYKAMADFLCEIQKSPKKDKEGVDLLHWQLEKAFQEGESRIKTAFQYHVAQVGEAFWRGDDISKRRIQACIIEAAQMKQDLQQEWEYWQLLFNVKEQCFAIERITRDTIHTMDELAVRSSQRTQMEVGSTLQLTQSSPPSGQSDASSFGFALPMRLSAGQIKDRGSSIPDSSPRHGSATNFGTSDDSWSISSSATSSSTSEFWSRYGSAPSSSASSTISSRSSRSSGLIIPGRLSRVMEVPTSNWSTNSGLPRARPAGRPEKWNDFHGFCEGAWEVIEDLERGMLPLSQPSGIHATWTISQCKKCCYRGNIFTGLNKRTSTLDPRIRTARCGIRYRFSFLAKSHRRCYIFWNSYGEESLDAMMNAQEYRCLFCFAEGWLSCIFVGAESLMNHIYSMHRKAQTPELRRLVDYIEGRVASNTENFDINVPVNPKSSEVIRASQADVVQSGLPDTKIRSVSLAEPPGSSQPRPLPTRHIRAGEGVEDHNLQALVHNTSSSSAVASSSKIRREAGKDVEDSPVAQPTEPSDHELSRSKLPRTSKVISPDGKLIATASSDRAVKLWDSATSELLHKLEGHWSPVISILFSEDGNLLASGTDDGDVKMWDVTTGESLPTLEAFSDLIRPVLFSTENTSSMQARNNRGRFVFDLANKGSNFTLPSKTWLLTPQPALTDNKHRLRLLLGWRTDFIREHYPWVIELLEEGEVSLDELVDLWWESENLRWVQSESWQSQQEQECDLMPQLGHLETCAHQLGLPPLPSNEKQPDSNRKTGTQESGVTAGAEINTERLSASHADSTGPMFEDSSDDDERFVKLETQEKNLMKRCGIGGIFPPDYPWSNPGFAILHPSWATIRYGDSTKAGPIVSSISTRGSPSQGPQSIKRPHFQEHISEPDKRMHLDPKGAQSVLQALGNVLNAVAYLHADCGCCDSFTVLFHSSQRNSVLRVVSISVRLLCGIYAAVQAAISQAGGWETTLIDACFEAMNELGLVDEFAPYLHADKQTPFNISRYLNFSALVAQVASLGLVTYSRGHSRDFYHDSLSRTVEKFVLQGLDSIGPSIHAERRSLACMGKMLGRRVWAFHMEDMAIESIQEPLLLSTTARNLLDTWGGSILSDKSGLNPKVFLRIGAGFVFAMGDQTEASQALLEEEVYCHWASDRDMGLITPGRFAMESQLLIGATCINLNCNLTVASCQEAVSGVLFAMGTRPPRWRTSERGLTATGGFHGVTAGGTITQVKDDGKFRKTLLMERWEKHENLRILNSPWGLELSLCTGIARRVPLKNLFHGEVLKYLKANLPGEWSQIESKAATIAEKSRTDLDLLIEGMTEGERHILRKATELLLRAMEYTGVDEDGQTLTLWWPEDDVDTPRGLKFDKRQYSGQNPWIPMIQDSESCAVFGIVTTCCLEHPELRKCQNPNPAATWKALDNIILVTCLTPVGMSPLPPLSYSVGERYVLWQREEILRVIKSRDPGQDVAHLCYDPRWWPIIVRKRRFSKWTKVRERDAIRDLGQDVLVL